MGGFAALLEVLAGIVFPRFCAGCLGEGPLLCASCAAGAARAPRRTIDGFDGTFSAFAHEGAPRAALLEAKLGGERRGARDLAGLLPRGLDADAVVPVPDSYPTRAQRGGSVTGVLASEYARQAGLSYSRVLAARASSHDLGGATREERLAAHAGRFRARMRSPARVLLVDDVVTSGATAIACKDALVRAGARSVTLVTFTAAVWRVARPGLPLERTCPK